MDARAYNIRDTAGYLVFASDDQDEFLAEADRRAAHGDESLFEGADPDQLHKEAKRAAQARQRADKQQARRAKATAARAKELATDPKRLAEAVARLESLMAPPDVEGGG